MTSAACALIAAAIAMQSTANLFGRDAPPERPTMSIFTRRVEYHGHLGEMSLPIYGEAVAAGEGAGDPKLKFTVGAFSAPAWALKNGRGEKPNIPAIMLVGKRFTAVL